MTALSSATALRRSREALDNSVSGQHTSIHGEVAAHHESTHGCILLGKNIGLVREVSLVLAAVDEDKARKSAGVSVAFVCGVNPPAAAAEAYSNRYVSQMTILLL